MVSKSLLISEEGMLAGIEEMMTSDEEDMQAGTEEVMTSTAHPVLLMTQVKCKY